MIPHKSKFQSILLSITALFLLINVTITAQPEKSQQSVRFAILGDRTGGHIEGIYGEVVEEIERLKPEFVITVGDMIEGYNDDIEAINKEWNEYDSIVRPLSSNLYLIPGNHDIWSDLSDSLYRIRHGSPYYSFDHGFAHLTVVDASRWDYGNDMPAEQIEWIEADLKAHTDAKYRLVFMHKPIWFETVFKDKADTLHTLFKTYNVNAVFTGHYHEYFCNTYDGIIYTSIGTSGAESHHSASEMEYHYAWVTLDNEGIHIAPIRKNSVMAWSETYDKDKLAFDRIRHFGLTYKRPVVVDQNLKAANIPFKVIIDNSYSDFELNDSIQWETLDEWEIIPQYLPITVPSGSKAEFEFTASCQGNIYPVPTMSVDFRLAEDRSKPVSSELIVARRAVCKYANSKPKIDGRLKEIIWTDPQNYFFSPDGKKSSIDPVEFYFAYDKKNIYLAAKCMDTKIDSIVSNVSERDGGIYGEDCVGYFIQPAEAEDTAYQIYFNSLGTVFDQILWIGEDGWMDGDREWNGDYDVKTYKGDDFWSIEVRIPVEQFGAKLESGKEWRINFRRKQKRYDSTADWMTPIEYHPQKYGILSLE